MKRGLLGSTLAWAPLAIAAVVTAMLLGATFLIQRSVQDASILVARGIGDAFAVSGWQELGGEAYPPSQEDLERFLEQHSEAGLRYVALVDGKTEREWVAAGTPVGSTLTDGVTLLEDRARLVARVRPRRPEGRIPRRMRTEEMNRLRPNFPKVVYEFQPLAALELQGRARGLFVVAGIFSLGALGIAAALSGVLRQRENLREELEHGKRLAALGSMSAVLAHELRNPLASAKGHAQLLAESVEAEPKLKAKADLVVSEVLRVEKLMADLLNFVKSGELRRTRVDPRELVERTVASTGAGTRVVVKVPEGVRAAHVDGERLQQALENILRNALEASAPEGRVTVEVREERADTLFEIHDSGPGITPGEEARIFEPFVTGRIHGVGLGLAITRRIVELHRGTVTARNRPGGGATFALRVPREES